ncbi:hypothetical protein [Actinomadura litoris]|uniref:hypothetical protein n=1 Tax=Actinomadura litoris TaxID=2678616 RepID=UPI001FA6AC67|nr:hypothetical protein [Actinomadura litoris]
MNDDLTLGDVFSMTASGYEAGFYDRATAVDVLAERTGWPWEFSAAMFEQALIERGTADDWRPLRDEQGRWTL